MSFSPKVELRHYRVLGAAPVEGGHPVSPTRHTPDTRGDSTSTFHSVVPWLISHAIERGQSSYAGLLEVLTLHFGRTHGFEAAEKASRVLAEYGFRPPIDPVYKGLTPEDLTVMFG